MFGKRRSVRQPFLSSGYPAEETFEEISCSFKRISIFKHLNLLKSQFQHISSFWKFSQLVKARLHPGWPTIDYWLLIKLQMNWDDIKTGFSWLKRLTNVFKTFFHFDFRHFTLKASFILKIASAYSTIRLIPFPSNFGCSVSVPQKSILPQAIFY